MLNVEHHEAERWACISASQALCISVKHYEGVI